MGKNFAVQNAVIQEFISVTKRAISSLVNFGKSAVQSFSHFQQLESSLQGLLRDEQKGTELFEHLRAFSFDTTFGVDTLAQASKQLLNVGVAVKDLDSTLLMMGNVAQGDTQKFLELVSVFSKIQNMGRATSMQLNQLALRGVPIFQMLKEMKVEGTATGEEITEAFRRMTAQGGQFYEAMDRINKTIQGKEGFVSDTWREFLTSFAEASGIADIYAKLLDVIYAKLQKTVDWLQEINENPVYQAMFRGALVAIIGSIATALSTKLVTALTVTISKVITLFTAQQSLNLASGNYVQFATAMTFAVGVLGITMGTLFQKTEEETKALEEQKKAYEDYETTKAKYDKGKIISLDERQMLAKGNIDYYSREIEILRKAKESPYASKKDKENMQLRIDTMREQILSEQEVLAYMEKQILAQEKLRILEEKNAKIAKENAEAQKEVLGTINSWYASTDDGKRETIEDRIAEYTKLKTSSLKFKNTRMTSTGEIEEFWDSKDMFSKDEQKKIDLYIKYLKAELAKLNETVETRNPFLEELKALENEISLFDLENEKLYERQYILEGFTAEEAKRLAFEKNRLDLMKEQKQKEEEQKQALEEELKARKELEERAKYSLSGLQNLYKEDGNVAGYYGVGLLQQTSAGSIVEGAMQGAEMGGVWGAVAGGLMSAVMQLEGFQKILTIVNKLVFWVLEPLNWLFNKIADWLGLEDEANEQKEKEIQRLKEVNEQYKSLSKAIDDQNQYYLALKQNLANETEKRLLYAKGVTDVNDMIITPNGNFSTHPDDYIIASKNPSELGGSKVNITINNNAGVDVSAQKSQNGDITNLVLTISKKVAGDYASGANGWDNAVASRSRRVAGTTFSR